MNKNSKLKSTSSSEVNAGLWTTYKNNRSSEKINLYLKKSEALQEKRVSQPPKSPTEEKPLTEADRKFLAVLYEDDPQMKKYDGIKESDPHMTQHVGAESDP